jgi:hypothetical protein
MGYWLRNRFEMQSTEERIRFEDAQLAHYPRLAEEAARTLLTNRALATAPIQLRTNHTRYTELCDFLDRKVVAMVEDASRFEWKEPTEDDSEDELPLLGGPATQGLSFSSSRKRTFENPNLKVPPHPSGSRH